MTLHYIDNLDARLEMFAAGYLTAKPIAERIFDRVRPLPGNLVKSLPLSIRVVRASRAPVLASRRNNLGSGNGLVLWARVRKSRDGEDAVANTRDACPYPIQAFCLRQVCLVNFEADEFSYATFLRCDGRISNAEKGVKHGLHARSAMKHGAPFR